MVKKDILHIGTHAGRSDFRRMVRINSTTEGVTTGISAYDGFIAEQWNDNQNWKTTI